MHFVLLNKLKKYPTKFLPPLLLTPLYSIICICTCILYKYNEHCASALPRAKKGPQLSSLKEEESALLVYLYLLSYRGSIPPPPS